MLSKIKVAQYSKKTTLKLKNLSVDLIILDVLWKKGFIYGYTKIQCSYTIFLKYSLQSLGILNSMLFLKSKLANKQLKTLITLDPNHSYLFLTNKGVSIHSTNIAQGGVKLIARL